MMMMNLGNDTHQQDYPEEILPEPTWYDTANAAYDQTRATGISTSSMNYSDNAYRKQLDGMMKEDPGNADLLNSLKRFSGKNKDLYEKYWNEGNLESFVTSKQDIKALDLYFKTVRTKKLKDIGGLYNEGKTAALKDYKAAQEILDRSDSTTAKLAGGMAGAMTDPLTIATLPAGGAAIRGVGEGIARTAGRAALQESIIASTVEPLIQVRQHKWSEEIGVKYGVKEAAANAVLSIGAAGLVRGVGSGAMDLTEAGIKALRIKDPELASDYEALTKNKVAVSDKEHIDNLTRTELEEPLKITSEEEKALMEAQAAKEFVEQDKIELDLVDYDGDLEIIIREGETASYKDIDDAIDAELDKIQKIKDCLL